MPDGKLEGWSDRNPTSMGGKGVDGTAEGPGTDKDRSQRSPRAGLDDFSGSVFVCLGPDSYTPLASPRHGDTRRDCLVVDTKLGDI